MFTSIPDPILERMEALEAWDARDRKDRTPRLQRLRQISPETGRLLALFAAMAPPGEMVEVGTSAGYSTLWLSLAAKDRRNRVNTFEVLAEKAALARETLRTTGTQEIVTLIEGDARDGLARFENIAFCFIDAEKEVYSECYDILVPRLVPGGLLIADNVISHREELQGFLDTALADPHFDSTVIPIGKGLLLARKR